VAIRELARGRIRCGIADAGIGGDGDDLLDRRAAVIPNFDFVRQVFPFGGGCDGTLLGRPSSRSLGGPGRKFRLPRALPN